MSYDGSIGSNWDWLCPAHGSPGLSHKPPAASRAFYPKWTRCDLLCYKVEGRCPIKSTDGLVWLSHPTCRVVRSLQDSGRQISSGIREWAATEAGGRDLSNHSEPQLSYFVSLYCSLMPGRNAVLRSGTAGWARDGWAGLQQGVQVCGDWAQLEGSQPRSRSRGPAPGLPTMIQLHGEQNSGAEGKDVWNTVTPARHMRPQWLDYFNCNYRT